MKLFECFKRVENDNCLKGSKVVMPGYSTRNALKGVYPCKMHHRHGFVTISSIGRSVVLLADPDPQVETLPCNLCCRLSLIARFRRDTLGEGYLVGFRNFSGLSVGDSLKADSFHIQKLQCNRTSLVFFRATVLDLWLGSPPSIRWSIFYF